MFPDTLPFPEPDLFFLRALERWQQLAGPPFPWSGTHMIQETHCVLANYRLHTVEISSMPHPTIGYLGWVEYHCLHPQAEEGAALAALARMTFFTGCGYETDLGFGTTRDLLRKRED
jgi:CRISPR/Cas system endoribonuclease Cas6 (RAMP superfamily)